MRSLRLAFYGSLKVRYRPGSDLVTDAEPSNNQIVHRQRTGCCARQLGAIEMILDRHRRPRLAPGFFLVMPRPKGFAEI